MPETAEPLTVPEIPHWRDAPRPGDKYMHQGDESVESIIPASGSYNKDKARLAALMDEDYSVIRVETYWMQWAPEEAEAEWRTDNCECEDEDAPHYTSRLYNQAGEVTQEPQECATTKPAEEVWDFWEDGYCPWQRCGRNTKDAVKFRRAKIEAMKGWH